MQWATFNCYKRAAAGVELMGPKPQMSLVEVNQGSSGIAFLTNAGVIIKGLAFHLMQSHNPECIDLTFKT